MKHLRIVCRAFTVAAAALLPAGASAQLDLDSTQAPKPGEGRAALERADRLEADAERMAKAGRAEKPDPAPRRDRTGNDSALGPADAARIAARRLAARLLRAGEESGESGSVRVLAGTQLDRSMAAIDAALTRAGLDEAERERLVEFATFSAQFDPRRAGATEWELALVLRPLVPSLRAAANDADWARPGAVAGWFRASPDDRNDEPIGESAAAWRAAGLSDEAVQTLAALDATAPLGARALARRASRVLSIEGDWIGAAARPALARRFGDALSVFSGSPGPTLFEDCVPRLESLSAAADMAERLARIARERKGVKGVREAGTAVAGVLSAGPAEAQSRVETARALGRVLDLLIRGMESMGEKDLVREVRPAFRAAERSARLSEGDLIEGIPRLAQGRTGATDPAVVGLVGVHARRVGDLVALRRVSRWLEGRPLDAPAASTPPVTAPDRATAAARILKLGQEAADPRRAEAAFADLRRIAEDLPWLESIPSESALRSVGAAADRYKPVIGDRGREILGALDRARRGWRDAWGFEPRRAGGKPGETPPAPTPEGASARLRLLAHLGGMLEDLSLVHEMGARADRSQPNALDGWAGWALSAPAFDRLTAGMEPAAGALVEVAVTADEMKARPLIDTANQNLAACRLVARLERDARGRDLASSTPAVVQLASDIPINPWCWRQREGVAAVCRYLEEEAAARGRGDRARGDSFRKAAIGRAKAVLDQIGPDGVGEHGDP
ncbi:MAG: hypothetical protein JNM07_11260 [Phycisphaerae bacterium]|nr:hypothetical protein [Phycisphaerae bacterium]